MKTFWFTRAAVSHSPHSRWIHAELHLLEVTLLLLGREIQVFVHLGVIFFTVLLEPLSLFLQDTGVKVKTREVFSIDKAFSTRRQLIDEHTEGKKPVVITRARPNRERRWCNQGGCTQNLLVTLKIGHKWWCVSTHGRHLTEPNKESVKEEEETNAVLLLRQMIHT